MDRSLIVRRFNACVPEKRCLLIHPKNDVILDTRVDARLSMPENRHMTYFKLELFGSRSEIDKQDRKAKLVVLINYQACVKVVGSTEQKKYTQNDVQTDKKIKDPELEAFILEFVINFDHLSNEKFFTGTSPITEIFRRETIEHGTIRMLVFGKEGLPKTLQDITRLFNIDEATNPLNLWYQGSTKNPVSLEKSLLHPTKYPSTRSSLFLTQSSFFDWRQYATVHGYGSKMESEFNEREKEKFEETDHELFVVQGPETNGPGVFRAYWGAIRINGNAVVRLRAGMLIKIRFWDDSDMVYGIEDLHIEDSHNEIPTTDARILRDAERITNDYVDVKIIWPVLRKTQEIPSNIKMITPRQRLDDHRDFQNLLEGDLKSRGIRVRLKIIQSEDETVKRLNSLQALDTLASVDASLNHQWKDLLVANRLDRLRDVDLFQDIRRDQPDFENKMGLNQSQIDAVRSGRTALGAVLSVHGPPGTGKTTLLCACVNLFFESKKPLQIVAATQANIGVDSLVKLLNGKVSKLPVGHLHPEAIPKYVVRLHNKNSELAIFWEPTGGNPRMNRARSSGFPARRSPPNDSRIRQRELSVGYRMLQVIGKENGGARIWPDRLRGDLGTLQNLYSEWTNATASTPMKATRIKQMENLAETLYVDIISKSSAIVGTVSRIGMDDVTSICRTSTSLIFIDEASRLDDSAFWPLMAVSYEEKMRGFVLVGDHHQLRNVIKSSTESNAFAHQKMIGLPERLERVGFPTLLLKEQMRMIPEISAPSLRFVYDDQVINGPGTAVTDRRIAQELIEHNQRSSLHISSAVVFVDIAESPASTTKTSGVTSRANQFYMRWAFNKVQELLECNSPMVRTAKIAFASPYTNDTQNALAARARMVRSKVANVENFEVVVWEAAQGLEYDIGIIVLPLIADKGSFLHEMHRLNMILTRWKCGLYIIGCEELIRSCGPGEEYDDLLGGGVDWLKRFFTYYSQFKVQIPDTETLPACRWD